MFVANTNDEEIANFMATIAANVDNETLSDAEFREFIRNTLYPIVEYQGKKNAD